MAFDTATKGLKNDGSAGGSGGSMISSSNPAPVSGGPSRKDPNEEFFMMTFLSY